MSLLVRWKILRLFIDTMTADNKYFCHYKVIFNQPIQMQLTKKQIPFF